MANAVIKRVKVAGMVREKSRASDLVCTALVVVVAGCIAVGALLLAGVMVPMDAEPNTCMVPLMYPTYKTVLDDAPQQRYRLLLYMERKQEHCLLCMILACKQKSGDLVDSGVCNEDNLAHLRNGLRQRRPLLFVHGHSGSHEQARALGSEMFLLEQGYAETHMGVDVYTVDFASGQLSAFSGALLKRQSEYLSRITKILEQEYAKKVIIVAHSMGGIAARLARASPYLVTLGTPHRRPVVPLCRELANLYRSLDPQDKIVAISGSLRDLKVIPSVAAPPENNQAAAIRLSTQVAGASCSHEALVWCQQLACSLAASLYFNLTILEHDPANFLQILEHRSLTGCGYNLYAETATFTSNPIDRASDAFSGTWEILSEGRPQLLSLNNLPAFSQSPRTAVLAFEVAPVSGSIQENGYACRITVSLQCPNHKVRPITEFHANKGASISVVPSVTCPAEGSAKDLDWSSYNLVVKATRDNWCPSKVTLSVRANRVRGTLQALAMKLQDYALDILLCIPFAILMIKASFTLTCSVRGHRYRTPVAIAVLACILSNLVYQNRTAKLLSTA